MKVCKKTCVWVCQLLLTCLRKGISPAFSNLPGNAGFPWFQPPTTLPSSSTPCPISMTGQLPSRHELLWGHLREPKNYELTLRTEQDRAWEGGSRPLLLLPQEQLWDWPPSRGPGKGGSVWGPLGGPWALSFLPVLRRLSFANCARRQGSRHLLPSSSDALRATTLTLGPSGPGQPTGPGMPGTPGGPGLPFKDREQKLGLLGLFPSLWKQVCLCGPVGSMGPSMAPGCSSPPPKTHGLESWASQMGVKALGITWHQHMRLFHLRNGRWWEGALNVSVLWPLSPTHTSPAFQYILSKEAT